jgi:hypothetical protein
VQKIAEVEGFAISTQTSLFYQIMAGDSTLVVNFAIAGMYNL